MSAHVVLCCDGHRHGQPCRAALHTRELSTFAARLSGDARAWRSVEVPDAPELTFIDLCPSLGHDEEPAPC